MYTHPAKVEVSSACALKCPSHLFNLVTDSHKGILLIQSMIPVLPITDVCRQGVFL